jgi:hypothetical protein
MASLLYASAVHASKLGVYYTWDSKPGLCRANFSNALFSDNESPRYVLGGRISFPKQRLNELLSSIHNSALG